ncbi:MAG: glycosyltransferase [Nitrososphaerota archaeon]|nr:glycosyltransferase [Nitrososphaerota archaeon]
MIRLKRRTKFRLVSSMFLFIPSPIENIRNRYGFPKFKYSVYYLYQRILFNVILRRADALVITNPSDQVELRERPLPFLAIYGGVNLEEIQVASSRPSTEDGPYDVIFCGRLHEQKGISGLLEIWQDVIATIPDARLGVIGNGSIQYETYLKRKATSLNLTEKNLTWLGYVNGVDKYRLYLNSKVFAHPTIYDNNGMVAAEALCSGLPVVMYDLPSLRAVYQVGCIKVPRFNPRAYAEALVSLLSDKDVFAYIAPKEVEVRSIQMQWDWGNRMNEFATFLRSI